MKEPKVKSNQFKTSVKSNIKLVNCLLYFTRELVQVKLEIIAKFFDRPLLGGVGFITDCCLKLLHCNISMAKKVMRMYAQLQIPENSWESVNEHCLFKV